jgi:hypothetical protein
MFRAYYALKDARRNDTMDIGGWLRGLGLERYEQAFRENEIDLRVLPELTADHLKELGIDRTRDRCRGATLMNTAGLADPITCGLQRFPGRQRTAEIGAFRPLPRAQARTLLSDLRADARREL